MIKKEPKWAEFSTIIGYGTPFIIIKMPEYHMRWSILLKSINKIVIDLGFKAKDIFTIEGLISTNRNYKKDWLMADYEQNHRNTTLPGLIGAFDGSVQTYKQFYLFAWNEKTEKFDLIREPLTT